MLSVPRLCNLWANELIDSCEEAGSNTSTIALRVFGGDEKRTQCWGV
jgi:hypothetical protein